MADFNSISTISTLETAGSSAFTEMELSTNAPTVVSTSLTGRKQVKTVQSQNWQIKARLQPMTHEDFKPVYAFIVKQKGQAGTFTINLPHAKHQGTITTGTATGTIGSTSLTVSATGTLKAGDLLSFNDTSTPHEKVYMVVEDVTLSGSGTVTIEPGLQKAVSSATFQTGTNCDFRVRLTNDVQTYRTSASGFYTYEMDFEEVI